MRRQPFWLTVRPVELPSEIRRQLNRLLESIDRVLTESPASLGFPPEVVDAIEKMVPEHRKNTHYLAEFFKDYEARFRKSLFLNQLFNPISVVQQAKVLKKFGVRGVKAKEEEAYSVRDHNDITSKLSKLLGSIDTISDLLTLRKKIRKALDDRRAIKRAQDTIDTLMIANLEGFEDDYPELINVLRYDKNSYREFKNMDLNRAANKAEGMSVSPPRNENRVLMELPGGYYWYELDSVECSIEGDQMEHCGAPDRSSSVMYSLRDGDDRPQVTVEYDPKTNEVVQIKGSSNSVPKKEHWKLIAKLVGHFNAHVVERPSSMLDGSTVDPIKFLKAVTKEGGTYALMTEEEYEELRFQVDTLPEHLNRLLADEFGRRKVHLRGDAFFRQYNRSEYDLGVELDIEISAELLSNYDKFVEITEDHMARDEVFDHLFDIAQHEFASAFEPDLIWRVDMNPPGVSPDKNILLEGIDFDHDIATISRSAVQNYVQGISSAVSPGSIRDILAELEGIIEDVEVDV